MELEDLTYYPPKPEINDRNTASIIKTVVSLVAFVGLFLFLPISINTIFLVVLVLFLHEMGHLIAMKAYGYEDVGMFFIPFIGAVVTGRKEEMTELQRILIVLAGPIPGIIIGIGIIMGVHYLGWQENLLLFGLMFIALNVMNLIPIDPLDGGRLFELLFFSFNDTAKLIFQIISSLLLLSVGLYYNQLAITLFGIFLTTRISSGIRLIKIRKRISLLDIPLEVSYTKLSDKDYWMIRKEYIYIAKLDNIMEAESKEYDEKEEVLASAIRNLLKSPVKKDVNVVGKLFFFLVWVGSILGSFFALYPILDRLLVLLNNNI
jgi:Zn-dependent protease